VALRLVSVSSGRVDPQLALLGAARFVRARGDMSLELPGDEMEATRALAFAGIQACPAQPADIPAACIPAIAAHLEPIRTPDAVWDVVTTRPVSLSEATAVLLRRRALLWHPSQRDRDHCRSLLHDADQIIAWRRVIWCRRPDLRALTRHARLRPVIFDRRSLDRSPARWTYASQDAIGHWAFA
jgi:hypothetical protein